MHSLDRNVSFFTQNPFAPRELPRFTATMGSSDSCDSFRPAGLPSSRQNFPDTPPFYAPPCFPRQKSGLALLFGFTHYETLAAWVVGVTGRNSEGSLALRLIRLYDRASTVESPLPWPVILSDRRFLIRVNTFQFTSSAKFAWRTINAPFVTAYFTKSVPRQIVDRGRSGTTCADTFSHGRRNAADFCSNRFLRGSPGVGLATE